MTSKLNIFLFCAAMLLGWSCDQSELEVSKDAIANVDPKLEGTWLLVNGPLDVGLVLDGDKSRGPAWITLLKDGKMRGHSSRNLLGGKYTTKDNKKIDLEVNMLTRVADNPFSTWFMEGVRTASEYRIEGSNLTFLNESSSRQELIFAKLEDQCRPVLKDNALYNAESKEVDVVINQAYQIENCLVLDVTYSGGCVEQEPELVWNGNLSKSLPPLASLKLHYTKSDDCEALLSRTYYFDLLPFFKAAGYDEIRVNVIGLKGEIMVTKQ
ncbi:MAG TPA: hypothetical protein PLC89_28915 [Haliscomenobacter sp.]|uniref:META domain-containing protein n=1 Tax=Haliscomenobacter sp. TaxID=2717303 RepID=UPI002C54851C|nr:hypothetical protein [Haliscomenobacter sp.]HOY21370.1 hypothetical protein [Haliscomenobacter sp.]HPH18100.1 hypothetical protein [Haliscomenobacter sp.]